MTALFNNSSDSESESDYNEEKEEIMLRNFETESKLIINNLLPKKSCEVYENVYATFIKWHNQNKATSFSENILIVYFNELAKKYRPTTLWAKWSMLRTTLNLKEGIDINTYNNLKTYLKNHAKGYKPKKAKSFTLEQIKTFIENAENNIYLAVKVFVHLYKHLNNYLLHINLYDQYIINLYFVGYSCIWYLRCIEVQ